MSYAKKKPIFYSFVDSAHTSQITDTALSVFEAFGSLFTNRLHVPDHNLKNAQDAIKATNYGAHKIFISAHGSPNRLLLGSESVYANGFIDNLMAQDAIQEGQHIIFVGCAVAGNQEARDALQIAADENNITISAADSLTTSAPLKIRGRLGLGLEQIHQRLNVDVEKSAFNKIYTFHPDGQVTVK